MIISEEEGAICASYGKVVVFRNEMVLMAIKENERKEKGKGWERKQCRMER